MKKLVRPSRTQAVAMAEKPKCSEPENQQTSPGDCHILGWMGVPKILILLIVGIMFIGWSYWV